MAEINTAPISGMRDFLPLDVLRRNYVIEVVHRVYQSYGFEPLETPTMERLSTLLGKYGEEGDQLIFRVLKRGEKLAEALADHPTEESVADAGLRYDLTVPLARIVTEYRERLPRVFKRYQIQPVYRADRPAKGRYREFMQCDVDIVGSASQTVEAEVLNAGAEVLHGLGFGPAHPFALRINHRGVLRGVMEVAGVPPTLENSALVAIDKLDKIGLEGVRRELDSRGVPPAVANGLLETMSNAPQDNAGLLAWLEHLLSESELGGQGLAELRRVLTYCESGPAAEHLRIDPYLARGLSYYTGAIYEIEFPGFSGSGGAGGRYDELIGMFSRQKIPACGFSLGLERIILFMEEQGMFPARLRGQPQVLVTLFDAATTGPSLGLAHELRRAGLRVDVYPDAVGFGKQIQYAVERNINYVAFLGSREVEEGVVRIKDLSKGDQEDVARGEVVSRLVKTLSE